MTLPWEDYDRTWEEYDKKEELAETKLFIQTETTAAKHTLGLLRNHEAGSALRLIQWIAADGLIGKPKAITIMRHVYKRFLNSHTPPTPDEVLDRLIEFYTTLLNYFDKAGIEI